MDLAATPGHIAGFPLMMNLRELGGIEAADGRRVRHGLLYRGGALANLTLTERARIDGFGLRRILDLRSAAEASESPDYVPEGAEYLRIAGMYDEDGGEMDFSPRAIARLATRIGSPLGLMRALYTSMAYGNPAMRALVEHLAAGSAPLYVHCSAGKDRTGVAAAVILSLLGVPDAVIVRDFLLTNEYRAELIGNPPAHLPAWIADSSLWARMNGVDERDLRAVFAAMDKGRATREEYFADEFGLDGRALAALRDRYLE